MNETEMTLGQARDLLTQSGYDAYGSVRVYGVIGSGECAGQILSIKSAAYLDRFEWSRVYFTSTTTIPTRKA